MKMNASFEFLSNICISGLCKVAFALLQKATVLFRFPNTTFGLFVQDFAIAKNSFYRKSEEVLQFERKRDCLDRSNLKSTESQWSDSLIIAVYDKPTAAEKATVKHDRNQSKSQVNRRCEKQQSERTATREWLCRTAQGLWCAVRATDANHKSP